MDLAKLGFEVDTAGLRRGEQGLKGLDSAAQRTDKSAQATTRSLSAMGNVARIAIAAIGGLTLGRVINETADFEQAMLGVRAVTRATADEYQILTNQARELGATTVFSARQAADAQRFLAQAGFEVNEVLSATPGVIQLAVAAGLDLSEAADLASNALSGFRLEVDQLGRVNDVLANTAASANTDVRQLGQALSFAAPIATAAGVSIEETAAAIGALSDAGLQASRAGTGLVGFIRQLSRVTPQAQQTLEKYGITLEDIDITTRGLQPVMETLAAANISVSDSFQIFGSEAGAAAQILLGTSERVDQLTQSNREASGSAQEMADIMGSGLRAAISSLNSAASEAVLQIGEGGLGSSMAFLIRQATGVLSVYNDMLPQFAQANDLSEEQARQFQLTAIAIQSLGAGVAVIGGITLALRAATIAQIAFNAAVRANPFALIASAATAAAVAIYQLRNANDDLVDVFERATASTASWEAAQAKIPALVREINKIMERRTEIERERQELEEKGFKRYGRDATRHRRLGEELEELKQRYHALTDARIAADRAEQERRQNAGGAGDDSGSSGLNIEIPGLPDDTIEKMERRRRALLQSLETEKQSVLRAYGERDAEITALEEANFLTQMQAAQARLDNERQKQEQLTQIAEDGTRERLRVEQQAAQAQQRLNMSILAQASSFGSQFAGAIKAAAGEQSNAYKAAFLAQQGFAIASAIINTELAAVSALAPPPIGLGPVAGLPYAATIRGFGYASAGLIGAQTIGELASFDGGGYTGSGPRSGGMDGKGGFMAMLHPNETVIDHTKGQGQGVVININNAPQGTRTESRQGPDGQQIIDVFISDMSNGGPMSRSVQKTFGMRRQGR